MAIVQIQMNKQNQVHGFALFNLGFRPFFLGASIFSVVTILIWMLIYRSDISLPINGISKSQWHAHEMLYGYGMAVVAGFLLTAVKNWTGIQTLHGRPLMVLFALWCTARILFLFGTQLIYWVVLADILFGLMLLVSIANPILRARQWKQLAIVGKLILLLIGNIVFYLGCYGLLDNGMLYAINGAVFLFISLILMMGRRVIPFFIERGVVHLPNQNNVQLKQYKWLDNSILLFFGALFMNELFIQVANISIFVALALFVLNGFRLFNWHTRGIWRVPLLWSLYISAWLINIGFLFYGIQHLLNISMVLILHFFTVGGIGLMTLAMMARVALGHSGRDIKAPSPWLTMAFVAVIVSVFFRVIMPMFFIWIYPTWVFVSALFWMIGFTIFIVIYAPILLKPRVDGLYG